MISLGLPQTRKLWSSHLTCRLKHIFNAPRCAKIWMARRRAWRLWRMQRIWIDVPSRPSDDAMMIIGQSAAFIWLNMIIWHGTSGQTRGCHITYKALSTMHATLSWAPTVSPIVRRIFRASVMRNIRALLGAAFVLSAGRRVSALPQAASSDAESTGVPSITLSTTVAAPTAPLTNDLPSQVALPPVQAWCPSQIFCAGNVSVLLSLNCIRYYNL